MSLRILITNDDGVDAPGMQVMREIARTLSDDVWVVAPDGNQSGAAHRFTFGRELELARFRRRPRHFAHRLHRHMAAHRTYRFLEQRTVFVADQR